MFGCALESDFPQHRDGNAAFAGQGGVVGHGKASLLHLLGVPLH